MLLGVVYCVCSVFVNLCVLLQCWCSVYDRCVIGVCFLLCYVVFALCFRVFSLLFVVCGGVCCV